MQEQVLVIEGRQVKYRGRIQTMATGNAANYDLIMRMIPTDVGRIMTLQEHGYLPSQRRDWSLAVARSKRLICLAGVVGSGKSRAMQSLFASVPQTAKKYSIEDPAEYFHPNCTTISISRSLSDPKAGEMQIKAAMGGLKRGDLTALLFGEIRDRETAAFVREILLAGNPVFSTIHASSWSGMLARFIDIGVTREELANEEFIGIFAYQSLVLKVCPHCALRGDEAMNALGAKYVSAIENKFLVDGSLFVARNPKGCDKCRAIGIPELYGGLGRTVVAEQFMPVEADRVLIEQGKFRVLKHSWAERRASFMDEDTTGKTVLEVALYKCLQGTFDPRVVEAKLGLFSQHEIYGGAPKQSTGLLSTLEEGVSL